MVYCTVRLYWTRLKFYRVNHEQIWIEKYQYVLKNSCQAVVLHILQSVLTPKLLRRINLSFPSLPISIVEYEYELINFLERYYDQYQTSNTIKTQV